MTQAIAAAHLHLPLGALIELSLPKGASWEFLVIFATILLGPVLIERARAPGIVGLLLGGYVIGPHGLNLIRSGNTTVPDLGQLGLLYLMFVAGIELDLNLLRKHRRSVIVFGLLTFALPMTLGTGVGLTLGWDALAAILLGSLLASHTLISYPTVRDAGLAQDPAVATAVGSTVLTDTITLVVLAAVAGAAEGRRSTLDVTIQLIVGLAALIAFSLLLLPRLGAWAFRVFGAERSVRYIVAITAFLAAAAVAEAFGIEGIVGAFFAGLALNRLVPNEGQLMDRIGFFGGAVFIPVFLVSVGLILDPSVLVKLQTLEYAGLFILACLGGKLIAARLSAWRLGFSRAQADLLFSLSAAQAAATLAATVIGFQIGLFSSTVVNAVLILIFISVLVSTIVAKRAGASLARQPRQAPALGARVVVGVGDPSLAQGALAIAVRIARADGGVVLPVLVLPQAPASQPRSAHAALSRAAALAGVDGLISTVLDRSVLHGAVHAGLASEATLVLVAEPVPVSQSERTEARKLVTELSGGLAPVAIVRGAVSRLGSVHLLEDGADAGGTSLASEMARRVAHGPASLLASDGDRASRSLGPQDVLFLSAAGGAIQALEQHREGLVVATLSEL